MTAESKSVEPPERGTSALLEYFLASICDLRLLSFVTDAALRADYSSYIARQALDGKTDYKKLSPTELAQKDPGKTIVRLRQSRQEFLEMFFSRAVDNFEVYLVDLIRLALHKEPRVLSDRKQELTLGHILKFDSIEALSRDIIEGKLNSLSYDGFGALEDWCTGRNIPLVVPHGRRDDIVELVALRNIIVHSRGKVDERYKATVPTSAFKIGEKREITFDELYEAKYLLDSVVVVTDNAVSGKFRLDQTEAKREISKRVSKRWPGGEEETPGGSQSDSKSS